jgi:hypothetical protein
LSNQFQRLDAKDSLGSLFIHIIANLPLLFIALIFYHTFGFYGWSHLISGIFLMYSVIRLDRFIDLRHKFPWHIIPLVIFSAYHYPLITILVLAGGLLINLRAITKRDFFAFERVEGLGMFLIGVFPFVLPLGVTDPIMFLGPALFVLGIDSFHKIGHRETSNLALMWTTGIAFFTIAVISYIIFFEPPITDLLPVIFTIYGPLIGFKLLKNRSQFASWLYYQIWQCFIIIILFIIYANLISKTSLFPS